MKLKFNINDSSPRILHLSAEELKIGTDENCDILLFDELPLFTLGLKFENNRLYLTNYNCQNLALNGQSVTQHRTTEVSLSDVITIHGKIISLQPMNHTEPMSDKEEVESLLRVESEKEKIIDYKYQIKKLKKDCDFLQREMLLKEAKLKETFESKKIELKEEFKNQKNILREKLVEQQSDFNNTLLQIKQSIDEQENLLGELKGQENTILAKIDEDKGVMASLLKRHNDLADKSHNLEKVISVQTECLNDINEELINSQSVNDDLVSEIKRNQKQCAHLNKVVNQKESHLNDLKRSLEKKSKDLGSLETQLKTLKNDVEDFDLKKSKFDEIIKNIKVSQIENQKLFDEKELVELELSELSSELVKTQSDLKITQDNWESLQVLYNNKIKEKNYLEDSLQSLTSEHENLKVQNGQLKSLKGSLSQEIENLQLEVEHLSEQRYKLQGEFETLSSLHESMEESHSLLEAKYFAKKKEYDSLCVEHDSIKNNVQDSVKRIEELRQSEQKLNYSVSKLSPYVNELNFVKNEFLSKETELNKLKVDVKTTRDKLNSSLEKFKKCENDHQGLMEEYSHAKINLEQYHQKLLTLKQDEETLISNKSIHQKELERIQDDLIKTQNEFSLLLTRYDSIAKEVPVLEDRKSELTHALNLLDVKKSEYSEIETRLSEQKELTALEKKKIASLLEQKEQIENEIQALGEKEKLAFEQYKKIEFTITELEAKADSYRELIANHERKKSQLQVESLKEQENARQELAKVYELEKNKLLEEQKSFQKENQEIIEQAKVHAETLVEQAKEKSQAIESTTKIECEKIQAIELDRLKKKEEKLVQRGYQDKIMFVNNVVINIKKLLHEDQYKKFDHILDKMKDEPLEHFKGDFGAIPKSQNINSISNLPSHIKSYWKKVGTIAAMIVLAVSPLVFTDGFYPKVGRNIASIMNNNFGTELFIQHHKKKKDELFYRPEKTNRYKNSMRDNIISTKGFVDIHLDTEFQNQYVNKFNQFFVNEFLLDESLVFEVLKMETNLIKDLLEMNRNLKVSNKETVLKEMAKLESKVNGQIKAQLGSDQNFQKYKKAKRALYLDYKDTTSL